MNFQATFTESLRDKQIPNRKLETANSELY
jgi:hypothetical protein